MKLICGFLHLDTRSAEVDRLSAMLRAMIAPGLDPRAEWLVDGPAALAVLDFAVQPRDRSDPSGLLRGAAGTTLVADARIDEPQEARDPSGLLALLARSGSEALGRVVGDFALAAWDPRRRVLICARDGMGVRPLFFAHCPGKAFVFASLPRGVHASGFLARRVDIDVLADELVVRLPGPDRSLFVGLQRVPPGGWLDIQPDGIRSGYHWRPIAATVGRRRIMPADAAAEMASLVQQAVRRRITGSGAVAAHLSGGLDSTSVAILAVRALREQDRALLAYSNVPTPYGAYDFGGDQTIQPVLRQEPDIAWAPLRIDDEAAFVLPRMDEDQLVPADPADREIRTLTDAASRGASVLLSGWGGDEAASFTHRGVLAEALLAGWWRYLAAELGALSRARNRPLARVAWDELSPWLLPEPLRRLSSRAAGRAPVELLPSVIAGLLQRERPEGQEWSDLLQPRHASHLRLNLLTGSGLTHRAEHWAMLAARHGMAVAFPMLDRDLLEFALSLPSSLFLREGWTRRLFRDSMEGVLPEALRWKVSKADLTPEGPLYVVTQRPVLLRWLSGIPSNALVAGLFDLGRMKSMLRALPEADDFARAIHTGTARHDYTRAVALLRALRGVAYLEQHG